jgi:hypothetical protein
MPAKRRGGEGASQFVLLLADLLTSLDAPWAGVDLDAAKPDFSRTFPERVRLFPVADHPAERALAVMRAAPGQPGETRIMDFPAEFLPTFRSQILATNWLDYLSNADTRLVLVLFVTSKEADARDVAQTLALVADRDVNIVLIDNEATTGTPLGGDCPALFRPLQSEILRRGGIKIHMPDLHAAVKQDAQKKMGKAFAVAGRYPTPTEIASKVGMDFLSAALVQNWILDCSLQIAAAADHLFPTATAALVKASQPGASVPTSTSTLAPDFD